MFHDRGLTQQKIMNAIVTMYEKWKDVVKEIWVEKNSFGALYVQQLQRTSLPVKPVIMSAKNALRNSIHNVAILFENEMIRLPYSTTYTQTKIDVFCDELVGFPKMVHDDSIASFVHGLSALKKVGNNYVVAVGDKVLDYMGKEVTNTESSSPVQSILSDIGVFSHEDDDLDEDDPMTQRFSGLLD